MITTEEIYAWVHKIIDGPGGLHDFEYYEMAAPNIPRDEAVAAWTLRALANSESEEAGKILALIQEQRRLKRRNDERGCCNQYKNATNRLHNRQG